MRLPKMFQMYAGLPRSIYILFIARIVNSMGMFVYPFIVFFMTQKLGLSEQTAGLFATISGFTYMPASIIGGKVTDHFGRKKIILTFQATAAILFIACGFLGNSMAVPYLLIVAAFFGGLSDPASGAMVTDLTKPENRKAAFSLLYLAINVGVAIGPMIAGFLFKYYTRWIFWGDGITSLIALSLVLIFVPETIPTHDKIEEKTEVLSEGEQVEEGSVFSAILKRPFLIAFVVINSILSFVYAQHSFSIPIQLGDLYENGTVILGKLFPDGAAIFGTLMSINAISVLVLTVPLTNLTKKLKPVQNVSIAGLLYAVGFGMLFYTYTYPWFIVSTVLWTAGEILTVTNSGVYIANHSPINQRGRFSSIMGIISGMGYTLGPVIMGTYIKFNGVRLVWPLLFGLALLAFTLLTGLHNIEKTVKKRKTVIEA